jgi:hypothetical protein
LLPKNPKSSRRVRKKKKKKARNKFFLEDDKKHCTLVIWPKSEGEEEGGTGQRRLFCLYLRAVSRMASFFRRASFLSQ